MWKKAQNSEGKKKDDKDTKQPENRQPDDKSRHYVHDLNGISLRLLLHEITAEDQGDEAFRDKDYDDAIQHFTTAIEDNERPCPTANESAPKAGYISAQLYYKRALAYQKKKDWNRAVEDAERVCAS